MYSDNYNLFSRMKSALTLLAVAFVLSGVSAQTTAVDNTPYKIVFQLTTADTLIHKALVKQLNNIRSAAPKTRLEVVCHGMGIYFLVTEKTQHASAIRELISQGVDIVGCGNTLIERKINRSELLPEVRMVQAGIIEIVQKQRKKWSYIKAG